MQPRPRTPSESDGRLAKARRVHRHQKRRDVALLLGGLDVGEHDGDVGGLGIRDPDLAAGQHVAVAVLTRHRFLVGGVRPRLLLGEREGADRFARRELWQPKGLLLRGSELEERLGDERVVDGEADRHRGAGEGDGLDGERVRHVIAARAAFGRGNRHAHQPEASRLANQVARKRAAGVDRRGAWRDLRAGKRPRARDERLLFGGKGEVHAD